MGLKIKKYADGTPRPTWWARYMSKGISHDCDLHIKIGGTIPRDADGNISLSIKGDAAFEKSRAAAQREFDKLTNPHTRTIAPTNAAVPLSKLFARWDGKKRQREVTPGWRDMIHTWFNRFVVFAGTYARNHNAVCETVDDITTEIVNAWFDDIKSKFAWETVCKMMKLMRKAYADCAAANNHNPFADIILRGGGNDGNGTISRKPLSDEELERLFDITADDEFVHQLIVTAACTGMRIGDVCTLKWANVDLNAGVIECKTAKSGRWVVIPIFDRLRALLNTLAAIPADGTKPNAFVFPTAAAMYMPRKTADGNTTDSRDAIYDRAKPYFARAVFGDEPIVDAVTDDTQSEPRAFEDVIADAGFTDRKRERIIEVYRRNKAGEANIDIARALGVPRSQICTDLHDAEKLTGETLRPWAKARTIKGLMERTRQRRVDANGKRVGKRAGSVYGWHSLRHTFVVMALNAGVSVEKVRLIVGHGECETTIANYYNPTKEQEAARIRAQMANTAIGGGTTTPVAAKPTIDDFIAALDDEQKKALAKKLLGL